MRDNWGDCLAIWMDRLGTKEVHQPLVGRFLREITNREFEPLERELEWSKNLDKWASELEQSAKAFPENAKKLAMEDVNRFLGPPTKQEQLKIEERIRDAVKIEIHVQRISDALIFATPLNTPMGLVNTRGIAHVMGWSSSTFLASLAAGFPLRAAAAVGVGRITSNNSLIGPVLQEAYLLEQEQPPGTVNGKRISNWSRFRVSQKFVEFVSECKKSNDYSDRQCGNICEEFFIEDVTCTTVVNYAARHVPSRNELVCHAYRTAMLQIDRLSGLENASRRTGWERVMHFLRDQASDVIDSHAIINQRR